MAATATTFKKRQSLRDKLDHITTLEEDDYSRILFEEIEELERDHEAAKTFRHHAPNTIRRQDHHLEMYDFFIFRLLKKQDRSELSEDEINAVLFPHDQVELRRQMSLFMMYAFKRATPRAKAANTIEFRTLVQYRDSMMYWAGFHYHLREQDLNTRLLFNAMVKDMRYVQKRYGDALMQKEKTWLGLGELRQLLDFESLNNHCIEVSEQHQVLWCLGRLTALRAGSLVPSGRYSRRDPITWKAFTFTRGDEPGKFDLRVALDHINIKRAEDVVIAAENAPIEHMLEFKLNSPEPQNLIFSPAHRLLAMALRRGLIEGISTLDELFASERQFILIKASAINDTVFYASIPKGTALDTSKPLKAMGLTAYLQRRGYQVGYTKPITWYSIRRRAATDMVRRIGMEATRHFMGHTPESQTLERYYLNMLGTLDNMGVLTEQGIQNNGHLPDSAAWAPLALGRLEDAALVRSRGLALQQMTQKLIPADPSPPEDPSPLELANYRRRVRAHAQQLLVRQEEEWQREHMTSGDMTQRQAALSASEFAEEALRRAVQGGQGTADPAQVDQDMGETNVPGQQATNEDDLAMELDDEDTPEQDLEETLKQPVQVDETGAVIVRFDAEADAEAATTAGVRDIAYAQLAKSTMELLLDNSLSTHVQWSNADKTCPLCREDEDVGLQQQSKEYASAANLEQHMNGHFHNPISEWKRHAKTHCVTETGQYECPFCVEASIADASTYESVERLVDHIQDSSAVTSSRLHDELKAAAGWYEEEFQSSLAPPIRSDTLTSTRNRGKRRLQEIGIVLTPGRVLPAPVPDDVFPGLMRGPPPPDNLADRYPNLVQPGYPTNLGAIPSHLEGLLKPGYPPPGHYRKDGV